MRGYVNCLPCSSRARHPDRLVARAQQLGQLARSGLDSRFECGDDPAPDLVHGVDSRRAFIVRLGRLPVEHARERGRPRLQGVNVLEATAWKTRWAMTVVDTILAAAVSPLRRREIHRERRY